MEFDVKEKINLPTKIVTKDLGEYVVILAPDFPNWLVLNKHENILFKHLQKHSILDAMIIMRESSGIEEEAIIKYAQKLLTKITKSNFFNDANIESEVSMNEITKNIHINVTNDCNLRCSHCFLSAGIGEIHNIDYDKLTKFLDELTIENGSTDVVISGGEPLLYNRIYDLISFCKKLNHKVILFTNGLLINEDNIGFLSENISQIQISMEGVSKEYFERIRGKNSYVKLMKSLELIKKYNIDLTIAVTVLSETIDDVYENIIDFLDKYNYSKLNVRINDQIERKGNALGLSALNFKNYGKRKTIVNEILSKLVGQKYMLNPQTGRNVHFSNCGIGTNIVINYDSKIYPCTEYDIAFYTLDDIPQEIIKGFEDLNNNTSLIYMEKCKKCDLKYICNGGCRIKNKLMNGDFIKPCCDNDFKDRKYMRLLSDYLQGSE